MNRPSQAEIRVGSNVQLKSGSPDLKVVKIDGLSVAVEWFGEFGEMFHSSFPQACLMVA
jgi:uncharacterized protein YodC (DUF2158 family)